MTGVIMFGLETLPRGGETIIRSALLVTEGESDCLAAREAYRYRYDGPDLTAWYAVAVPGANTWQPAMRKCIEAFPLIYVLGDGDPAGRELNANVRRDVPWVRPVWLPPGEDVRSIILREGPLGLDPFLEVADMDIRLEYAFLQGRTIEDAERIVLGDGEQHDAA